MADYNAHTYYGKRCLETLGPEISEQLVPDAQAFQLGLYGPDPMEFSGVYYWKVKGYHQHWRDQVMPWLTEFVLGQDPVARSYAAGCLLHFVLDEKVHEAIDHWAGSGSSHYRLELALDALVLQKQNIGQMPPLCVGHLDAIHHVFPGLRPSLYGLGLKVMAKVVDWCRWRGEDLYWKVTQVEWDQAWYLLNLLESHVADGVKELEKLLITGKSET